MTKEYEPQKGNKVIVAGIGAYRIDSLTTQEMHGTTVTMVNCTSLFARMDKFARMLGNFRDTSRKVMKQQELLSLLKKWCAGDLPRKDTSLDYKFQRLVPDHIDPAKQSLDFVEWLQMLDYLHRRREASNAPGSTPFQSHITELTEIVAQELAAAGRHKNTTAATGIVEAVVKEKKLDSQSWKQFLEMGTDLEEELRNERDAYAQECGQLNRENTELMQKLADATEMTSAPQTDSNTAALELECEGLKQNVSTLEEALRAATSQQKALRAELETTKTDLTLRSSELVAVRAEAEKTNAALQKAESTVTARKDMTLLESEIAPHKTACHSGVRVPLLCAVNIFSETEQKIQAETHKRRSARWSNREQFIRGRKRATA